jgi:hypothetical protein
MNPDPSRRRLLASLAAGFGGAVGPAMPAWRGSLFGSRARLTPWPEGFDPHAKLDLFGATGTWGSNTARIPAWAAPISRGGAVLQL